MQSPPLHFDVHQYELAIDGRQTRDAPKVNWNHLSSTFRPRSRAAQLRDPTAPLADLCWGGGGGGGGGGGHAPASLAARPKSAGFPVRAHRSAKRRGAPASAEAAAAAAAAPAADSDDLADMWRLGEDDDAVELGDIFDQLAGRGDGEKQRRRPRQPQPRRQQPRPRSSAAARARSAKSATQLYQEHLLAEVARHREKARAGPRPLPPELGLFIPTMRTRLCRLYTGPSLLRPAGPASASSPAPAGFLPIACALLPLPAELRPLSRQQLLGGGGAPGGSVQVSSDGCHCVRLHAGGRGAAGPLRSSGGGGGYSDSCAICQRLRMLRLA